MNRFRSYFRRYLQQLQNSVSTINRTASKVDTTQHEPHTRWAFATVSTAIQRLANTIIQARIRIATIPKEFAILARESGETRTRMTSLQRRARSTIVAWISFAEVHLNNINVSISTSYFELELTTQKMNIFKKKKKKTRGNCKSRESTGAIVSPW